MKHRETPKEQPTISRIMEQLHASLDDIHRQDIAELIAELQQLEDTLGGDSDRWEQELYTVNRQCEYLRAGDSIARRRMALRTIHDLVADIRDMQSYRDAERERGDGDRHRRGMQVIGRYVMCIGRPANAA